MSESLDLRLPNSEQKNAIEHKGGVLLSAGAGSGKTFVLVEHIVYLFNDFYRENNALGIDDFSGQLKNYFSEIVLMTFTKKAAGELSLRLQKRFELGLARAQAGLEELDEKYWDCALNSLPYIYVGTIHGFCYRLITQGLIPGFSGSEEMISDVEFSQKIDGLIDLWFETHDREVHNEHLEALVLNKKALKSSFKEIFSDTDIRMLWSSFDSNLTSLENEVEIIKEAFRAFSGFEWDELRISLAEATPDSKKPPKFLEFLNNYNEVSKTLDDPFEFTKASQVLFDELARFPSAGKTAPEEAKRALSVIRLWRDFFKKYSADIMAINENFDRYESWGAKIYEIYKFTEENYLSDRGLTFTDLEFYCWKAVQNQQVCEQINDGYKYFIVDEFQDTSKVQFEIIKRILNDNMAKVFSVGDVKQAIYGFRGGELGVFKQAQENTYQNLSLKNNYRSCSRIINFNNSLFKELLPLGKDYLGEDTFTVPMIEQAVPEGKDDGGELHKINLSVDSSDEEKKSLTPSEQNFLEADALYEHIQDFDEEVCFLYRKLAPTKFLIDKLIKGGKGFTCQVKVNLTEDPLICLFLEFARCCAFPSDEFLHRQALYQINSILYFLRTDVVKEADFVKLFIEDYISYGLLGGFKRFAWNLGLSSDNLEYNWPTIQALAVASQDKAELVFENSRTYLGSNYSLDFQVGENPQKIKIMTTHASKGLEFSTVVLAGIHTNGVSKGGGGFFGKLPHSYKWMAGISRSKQFSSPAYILENEVNKAKDFSEFKRLFYVATTRAVNKIVWCDVCFKDKQASFSKSSWIQGLRHWESSIEQTNEGVSKTIKPIEVSYNFEEKIPKDLRLDLQAPIYQKDNLGLEFNKGNEAPLGLGSELSVTRLAMLAQCPRKFFLKNVLKINDSDLEKVEVDLNKEEDDLLKESEVQGEETDVFSFQGGSSANRGTEVHRCLEYAIKRNFIIPSKNELDTLGEKGVSWALSQLEPHRNNGVIFESEKAVKFSIFGQMVSGTPDLYFKNNNLLEIWDFKTGRSKGKDLSAYWLQLYSYGLALFSEKEVQDEIRLVLAFVDEENLIEKRISVGDIKDEIFQYWSLLSQPEKTNPQHCRFCEFDKICQR